MTTVGNVGIGQVFEFNGALFICLNYDWEIEKYPCMCIAARNHKYSSGNEYILDDNAKVDKLISEQRLKSDFIPKGIDYEME